MQSHHLVLPSPAAFGVYGGTGVTTDAPSITTAPPPVQPHAAPSQLPVPTKSSTSFVSCYEELSPVRPKTKIYNQRIPVLHLTDCHEADVENMSKELYDWNRCLNHSIALPQEGTILKTIYKGSRLACYTQGDHVCRRVMGSGGWETGDVARFESTLRHLFGRRVAALMGAGIDTATAKRISREDVIFIDIGGNVGSILFAVAMMGFRVITVEAFPYNAQLLHITRCLNNLSPNDIEIYHVAVGDTESKCTVLRSPLNKGNINIKCDEASVRLLMQTERTYRVVGEMNVVKFDTIMNGRSHKSEARNLVKLNDSDPMAWKEYVMKMDIEGFENLMLSGSSEYFSNKILRPHMMIIEIWQAKCRGKRFFANDPWPQIKLCKRLVSYGYVLWVEGKWVSTIAGVDLLFAHCFPTDYYDVLFLDTAKPTAQNIASILSIKRRIPLEGEAEEQGPQVHLSSMEQTPLEDMARPRRKQRIIKPRRVSPKKEELFEQMPEPQGIVDSLRKL